jgi:hypothetical protein
LACQDEDGQWAGGAFVPAGFTAKLWEAEGQPWTATAFTFDLLRDLGLPPGCAAARRTVAAVGANAGTTRVNPFGTVRWRSASTVDS